LPSVAVTGAWQALQSRRDQVSMYTRFLTILGSVSLLVGSLGIANVMLASVAERRSEIGLRIALGAARGDIVLLFLAESAMVCAFGATLGMAGAAVALDRAGIEMAISGWVVIEAAVAAVACGLLAGTYPAWRASTVDPVVSLQAVV
jgi:putative ABC transport system permease protein